MASFLAHSAALIAALAVLPQLVGEFWAYTLALYFLYAIAALGVGLCWGQAGLLPLGQAMFFGLAAYLSGLALIHFEDSWLLLVLLPGAALAPGLLAWGIGLLVFRGRTLTGPFFAMITLALTLLAFQIANSWNDVTGGFNGLKNIPSLPGLGDFVDLYYVSAAALAVCVLGIAWLRRAPAGVLWRAVAQNEQRVRFCGFAVQNAKAAVFGISGVLAGIGGALYAPQQNLVTPQLCGFILSADLVIWAAVGGRATLYGPVAGAVLIGILTADLRDEISYWEVILAAIFIVVVLYFRQGLMGFVEPWFERLWRRPQARGLDSPARPAEPAGAGFALDGIRVRMGSVSILEGLDLAVDRPGIYCLIGPNGAGKTSCFNAMTGELPVRGGQIRIFGSERTGAAADLLSRIGVGRKFQAPSLFSEFTVAENFNIGLWSGRARLADLLRVRSHLWSSAILREAQSRFSFLADEDRRAGDLSHGQRQILELVMVLIAEPRLILLDEPSAGLSQAETREVIEAIRWVSGRLDACTVIVEHDMTFVRELADRVFVLHQGRLLASGTVAEIQADERVRAVYVGAAA
ncbi:MAG: ATP-binding cassette domain-containing protein [Defluviicoccus sp.]|nr:ATP-binding cassette domain-containing protein [Defluviicoccus sp.]